jgi:hypothetical protein
MSNKWLLPAALIGGGIWWLSKKKPGTGAPGTLRGDVNADGVVNMADTIMAERIMAGLADGSGQPYTTAQRQAADVNGDGVVNQADLTIIQRIILGLE